MPGVQGPDPLGTREAWLEQWDVRTMSWWEAEGQKGSAVNWLERMSGHWVKPCHSHLPTHTQLKGSVPLSVPCPDGSFPHWLALLSCFTGIWSHPGLQANRCEHHCDSDFLGASGHIL